MEHASNHCNCRESFIITLDMPGWLVLLDIPQCNLDPLISTALIRMRVRQSIHSQARVELLLSLIEGKSYLGGNLFTLKEKENICRDLEGSIDYEYLAFWTFWLIPIYHSTYEGNELTLETVFPAIGILIYYNSMITHALIMGMTLVFLLLGCCRG